MTCEQMDTVTYPDRRVREELEKWIGAHVDVSRQPELARLFGVPAVPTAVAVASDGHVLGRKADFIEPEPFVTWLKAMRSGQRQP